MLPAMVSNVCCAECVDNRATARSAPRSAALRRRRLLAGLGWRDDALQPQIDRNSPVHLIAMNTQAGDQHSACPLVGPDLYQLHHALVGHGIYNRIAKGCGLLE